MANSEKLRGFGHHLIHLTSTGSTNDDARTLIKQGAQPGTVVRADGQTQGRGTHGRHWWSPPGLSLYCSVIDQVRLPHAELPLVTLAVGRGVLSTVRRYVPEARSPRIKWPNDVWVDGKKIAGILVECLQQRDGSAMLIIGVGLNVMKQAWPKELMATALADHTPMAYQIDMDQVFSELLHDIAQSMDAFIDQGATQLIDDTNQALALRDQRVQVGDVIGNIEGIEATGALALRSQTGLIEIYAGTVHVL